jgi:pSer/pThr/pTyr-binding forkhead associated (FHA) protein
VCPSCGLALVEATASFPPLSDGHGGDDLSPGSEGPLLIVRKGPEVGERFYVDRPRLTIGRDPTSDVFLNDITVSRSHAVVERQGGEITISDAGSLNGTYVNGVSIDRVALRAGDAVQIGRFVMAFVDGGGA